MLILDLNKLDFTQQRRIDEIFESCQKDFNSLIEEFYNQNCIDLSRDENLYLLFSNILSRNNYQSELFLNFVKLIYIDEYLNKNKSVKKIIVYDYGLYLQLLANYNSSNFKIIYVNTNKYPVNKRYKDFFHIIYKSILYILTSSIKRSKEILKSKEVILVDTFFHFDTIKNRKYNERNYTNILNYSSKENLNKIFFVPTILSKFSKKDLTNIQKNSDEKIIYKHDFLRFMDFLNTIKIILKFKFTISSISFKNHCVTHLINYAVYKNKFDISVYESLINFNFIGKLKNLGINIKGLIDWNENQPIDKGLIKGVKSFYKGIKVKGYRGFIVSNTYNMQLCPTDLEIKNECFPDEIIVPGRKLTNTYDRFTTNFKVRTGPAFRFVLSKKEKKSFNKIFKILVVLPFGINDSSNLILSLFKTISSLKKYKIKFDFKPHPTDQIKRLKSSIGNKNTINFIDKNFSEIIHDYDLCLGNTTTALIEALANKVPVIIIPNMFGITQNPIPKTVNNNIYKRAYNFEEVKSSIIYFQKNRKKIQTNFSDFSAEINSDYFIIPDNKNVNEFLNFE